MIPYVPTEEAEAACGQVNRTLSGYLVTERMDPAPPSRRRLRSSRQTRLTEQREAALIRIASITEAFCADRLLAQVESEMDVPKAIHLLELWESAAINATSTWENQKKHYKKWLNVDNLRWDFVFGVATARNAVAHGLGKLTRMQLKSRESSRTRLDNAGIQLVGDRVQIDTAVLRSVAQGCIAHILAVDEAVSARSA